MPLEKIKNLGNGIILGIWEISEDLHTLLNKIQTNLEDGSFKKITSKNKMKEWCAVRLTSMALSEAIKFKYEGIYKDNYGKPHLNNTDIQMSVSHSYPYVAVIMNAHEPVGVDIEFLEPRVLRLAKKFMCREEFEYSDGDLLTSTLIWSAKEALYKLHGRKRLIFKEELLIDPFNPLTEDGFYGKIIDTDIEKYEIHFERVESNAVVVYTFKKL